MKDAKDRMKKKKTKKKKKKKKEEEEEEDSISTHVWVNDKQNHRLSV